MRQKIVGRLVSLRLAALAVAVAAIAGTGVSAQNSLERHDRHDDSRDTIVFTIDVAEDFKLFNPTFVKPTDTQPERGSFFVTEGNIFPGGTIEGRRCEFQSEQLRRARSLVLPGHTPGVGDRVPLQRPCRAHGAALPVS